MVKDWCHLSLACTGVCARDIMVLPYVISNSFTWIGGDEVPLEFGGNGEM